MAARPSAWQSTKPTRRLLSTRNVLGPAIVDEISNPDSPPQASGHKAPETLIQKSLPFISSINGIDAANGIIYIAKSTNLNPFDPGDANCRSGRRRPSPCNGIVLIAQPEPEIATTLSAIGLHDNTASLAATFADSGVARYHVEITQDGKDWKPITKPQYISGSTHPLTETIENLKPNTIHKVRIRTSGPAGDNATNPIILTTAQRPTANSAHRTQAR